MCIIRKTHRKKTSRDPRGVAAVELAVLLPLVMLLVLGAIDFGRFAHNYIALTNASRSAAGFASMNPYTPTTQPRFEAKLREVSIDEMQFLHEFDAEKLQVAFARTSDANSLKRVRVELTYPFDTLVPWPAIPNHIDMQRSVEMRVMR
jgi:hypothetical protein